ncbi:MAG: hypothetical protein QM775_08995 [Pirellulales bacterium]
MIRTLWFASRATYLVVGTGACLVLLQQLAAQYIAVGPYHRPYTSWGYGDYGYPGYGWNGGWGGGATPAGATAMGMGALIQAQGAYNQMTAQAAVTAEQAKSLALDNKLKTAETYDKLRELNRQYVAEKDAREKAAFNYNAPAPKRPKLSASQLDPVTGEIRWPELLLQPQFQPFRDQLQSLFTLRAHDPSQVSYQQVTTLALSLRNEYDKLHDSLPTNEFFATRHFIEGLGEAARYTGYEPHPPTGG